MRDATEFPTAVVEPNAWKLKGVGMYGSDVDVVSLDKYRELAAQAHSWGEQCQRWAKSAIRMRRAIESVLCDVDGELRDALVSALDERQERP